MRARREALDTLLRAGAHADVVRESQDVVELILEGALRFAGIEPPKRHDVHRAFTGFHARFPPEWRETLSELRDALDQLARDRGPAFYGDEAAGTPASDLFGEGDARRAVGIVDRLLKLYVSLLGRGQ